jgi:secreted repeat protein with Y-X4-D motif
MKRKITLLIAAAGSLGGSAGRCRHRHVRDQGLGLPPELRLVRQRSAWSRDEGDGRSRQVAAGPAVRGALGARLGTTRRTDGKLEVTYNGHPLYRYVGDAKPGDTKGQDLNQFGDGWYVLSPTGKKMERGAS